MSKKVGRNDPCPCGSGLKYKKCCLNEDLERYGKRARKKGMETEEDVDEEIEKEIELDREREVKRSLKILQNGTPPQISRLAIMRSVQDQLENKKEMEEFSKESRDFLLKKWTLNKVRKMSTSEIIEKLNSLDVEFSEKSFREQARDYISAIELAEDCYYTRDYGADDDDFIWLAIIELWNRFVPDKINVEMIDDAMQEGYNDLENKDYNGGLEKWNKVWIMIKTIVPSHIASVEEVDDFMYNLLSQFIINWCQDYDMELESAGLKDESYFIKRIEYSREFRQLFPDSDDLTIQNMIRGEAESYAMLGDVNAAEKLFEEFIAEYPDDPWGYIGWGDMYVWPEYRKVQKDLDKAERIYKKGLEVCSYDEEVVIDRLKRMGDYSDSVDKQVSES